MQGVAQRFALPALGRAAFRRPTGKMLRRRKRLENAAESPASGARFVGKNWGMQDAPPKKQNLAFRWLDFTRAIIFYKPDFAIETEHELEKRQSRELAETYAEK